MNYSQTQLDQLDRLTERWVADHLQKGMTSKKEKELVTLENRVEADLTLLKWMVGLNLALTLVLAGKAFLG
jgi:hypothetical protein